MPTMISGSLFMVKVILFLFIILLVSCKKNTNPNYLFILVENLNSKTIYCGYEENQNVRSGFKVICDEFNKFTHVYTTSIQSLPAFASLITGLYPYSHNVRTNTDNFLSPEFKTFIEKAKEQKSYKTHFISGGPPFFRKAGIHQGFDVFDDHINSEKDFRSLNEILPNYYEQLKSDSDTPFMSFIHVADLKYPFKETQNEFGDTRNLTFESQLEEIDEKLFYLFKKLKSDKIWDNTKVFIIGLNGLPNTDFNVDFKHLSLKSDNTQIGFYYKDLKKNAMNSKPQTINTALSLKDIGQILNDTFSNKSKLSTLDFNFEDLTSFTNEKGEEFEYIVIESSWAKTNNVGDIRAAIVDENQLFIFDKHLQSYNKLSDSNEQYPQPINNSNRDKIDNYQKYLLEKNFQIFNPPAELSQFISEINALNKNDFQLSHGSEFYDYFVLLNAIEKKDILKIENIIARYPSLKTDICFKDFPKYEKIDNSKKCQNPLSSLFVQYLNQHKNSDRELKNLVLFEVKNFNTFKTAYKKNLKLNLDYFSRNQFKVDSLRPYIFISLLTN